MKGKLRRGSTRPIISRPVQILCPWLVYVPQDAPSHYSFPTHAKCIIPNPSNGTARRAVDSFTPGFGACITPKWIHPSNSIIEPTTKTPTFTIITNGSVKYEGLKVLRVGESPGRRTIVIGTTSSEPRSCQQGAMHQQRP